MTSTEHCLIAMRQLEKTYASPKGSVIALLGIDLEVRNQEFVSILGPSGCGKSTLLKYIAGLELISGGTLSVRGAVLNGPPDRMRIVFQSFLPGSRSRRSIS